MESGGAFESGIMAAIMAHGPAAARPPRRRTGTGETLGGAAGVTRSKTPDDGADPKVPVSPEERESFGVWLRREREMRDISLREIADTSKISLRYLQALEDDRFDLLPAPVFAKGFLRQYARYVGLDPEETVNFYLAASRDEEEETESRPAPAPTRPFPFALVALVAAALLIAVAWALTRFGREPAEEPQGVLRSVPAVEEPQASVPLAPEKTEPQVAPDPAPADEAPLVVTLDFRGDCWVEATIDGEPEVLGQLGVQGESLRLEAQELVQLLVGDVTMVDIEVNGSPYNTGPGSPRRELAIDLALAEAVAKEAAAADH